MASSSQPATPAQPAPRCPGAEQVSSRPMTRCECAGVSFQQVAREIVLEGRSFEEATRRTGCGRTCGACLPDLQRFLASL